MVDQETDVEPQVMTVEVSSAEGTHLPHPNCRSTKN
jgi:hypothetical protein